MKQMFCPKCKSKDIRMRIPDAWVASLGSHPGWVCNDCGLELPEFPTKEETIKKVIKKK